MADDTISYQYLTGAVLYRTIRNRSGQMWNGSAWETFDNDSWASQYAAAGSESPSQSGFYTWTFPGTITSGMYEVEVYRQHGSAASRFDDRLGVIPVDWDTTKRIGIIDLAEDCAAYDTNETAILNDMVTLILAAQGGIDSVIANMVVDTVWTDAKAGYLTGDAYARLGAPAGASVSADVAAIKAETAAIVTDTAELQEKLSTMLEDDADSPGDYRFTPAAIRTVFVVGMTSIQTEETIPTESLYTLVEALSNSNTTAHTGKLTVFQTDGVTEHCQIGLTSDADAEPITGTSVGGT